MNILMLTPDYPPNQYGGVGIHVDELCRHLVKISKNVTITVVMVRCDGEIIEKPIIQQINEQLKIIRFDITSQNKEKAQDERLEYLTYR